MLWLVASVSARFFLHGALGNVFPAIAKFVAFPLETRFHRIRRVRRSLSTILQSATSEASLAFFSGFSLKTLPMTTAFSLLASSVLDSHVVEMRMRAAVLRPYS